MGNCCSTKIKSKVNSDNTNNGIYAINSNASQFQQNFPSINSRIGDKKSCPYCGEPIGRFFGVRVIPQYNPKKCAVCNGLLQGENSFECAKCNYAVFHLNCVK